MAKGCRVVVLDQLTYAGNLANLRAFEGHPNFRFVHGDIADQALVSTLFSEESFTAVVNFAAESHVDRSIEAPDTFVQTNIVGTFTLLHAAFLWWQQQSIKERESFRFLQVSTDEVYGSLGPTGFFSEDTPYAPNSPYSASKAAADHLVRAYHHTYGLPTLTTNCSNNYGPYQFPEKLIPVVILKALRGEPIPVYGDGQNIRDWLFVEDHCRGLDRVLALGNSGETYAIGGQCEQTNLSLVTTICQLLDEFHPSGAPHESLISFVADRPGHDRRYAIDAGKMKRTLHWEPEVSFEEGLRQTVLWYLNHQAWCDAILKGDHQLNRLGLVQK
jgi:dTDP-glucose 4,6-dehydratase